MTEPNAPETVETLLRGRTGNVFQYAHLRGAARKSTREYLDVAAMIDSAACARLYAEAEGNERRAMRMIDRALMREFFITTPRDIMTFALDLLLGQTHDHDDLEALAGGASIGRIVATAAAQVAEVANRNEPQDQPVSEDEICPYERIRALEAALGDMVKLAECYAEYLEREADALHSTSIKGMETAARFIEVSDDIATAKALLAE